jgi:tRNA dimethylallyltransferase
MTSLWPFSPLAFSRRRRTSLNRSRRRSPRRSRRRRREEATIATATTPNDDSLADNGEDNPEDPSNIAAWGAASTYVSSLGPVFAQRVDKLPGRDWYRLRRLLEVVYTVSAKKQKKASQDKSEAVLKTEEEILQNLTEKEVYTGIRSGSLPDVGYDVRCFFLCPDERMTHFHTVDQRCEQMLLRGLLTETAALYESGELLEESQVTRAIGYRQVLEYLKRKDAKRNDSAALISFIDDFATATRQYAKKQMQRFRRDSKFVFIPVQMESDKAKRVSDSAKMITDMCKLSSENFDAEVSTTSKNVGTDEIGSVSYFPSLLRQS